MRRLLVITMSLFVWISGFALAQSYPTRDDPYLNDLADILLPEEEADLRAKVARIAPDYDLTILTIRSIAEYDSMLPSIETFGSNLFSYWELGTSGGKRGALIIVALDIQGALIVLDPYYGHDYDSAMTTVLGESMIPRFRDGYFAQGLMDGVEHLYQVLNGPDLRTRSQLTKINHASGCDLDACLKRKHAATD